MYNSVTNQIHICENITDFKEFARKLIHSMNMSQKDIETGIANELWVIKKIYANDKHLNNISILEHEWLHVDQQFFFDVKLCAMNLEDFI